MYRVKDKAMATEAAPGPATEPAEVARSTEEARLLAILTAAFVEDPTVRWLFPEQTSYLAHFPLLARALGGAAIELGTAWHMKGQPACMLWLPPGIAPEEQPLMEVIEKGIPARRHAEVFSVLEAVDAAQPTEPHWYLPLIGVDPSCQGRGLGSALLRAALRVCDRDGMPAYLEASSASSIPLYERHGFRRLTPVRVGSCPIITPMWREPKAPS